MTALLQDPTFWTLVAFVVFIVALFKPVKNALIGGLDSRIAQVRTEVEQAQELREEAQALLASYQRKQREAAQEAEDILNRANLGFEVMHERNAHNFPLDLASIEATPVALTAPSVG